MKRIMNQQLENYIKECLDKGYAADQIKLALIAQGWNAQEINSYFPNGENKGDRNSTGNLAIIFLRIGLASVFVCAAIIFTISPQKGLIYIPSYVTAYISGEMFLRVFTIYEVLLALWLLWGKWSRYSGLLCAATIFGFTVLNLQFYATLFRNIAIFFAALALSSLSGNGKS